MRSLNRLSCRKKEDAFLEAVEELRREKELVKILGCTEKMRELWGKCPWREDGREASHHGADYASADFPVCDESS